MSGLNLSYTDMLPIYGELEIIQSEKSREQKIEEKRRPLNFA